MSLSFPHFVANDFAGSRQETATLLVGTANEFGLVVRHNIATSRLGFNISDGLLSVLGEEGIQAVEPDSTEFADDVQTDDSQGDVYDPAHYTVAEIEEFVTASAEDYPDFAADVLAAEQAGKNRVTLVEWLTEFVADNTETSGNRAGKNNKE